MLGVKRRKNRRETLKRFLDLAVSAANTVLSSAKRDCYGSRNSLPGDCRNVGSPDNLWQEETTYLSNDNESECEIFQKRIPPDSVASPEVVFVDADPESRAIETVGGLTEGSSGPDSFSVDTADITSNKSATRDVDPSAISHLSVCEEIGHCKPRNKFVKCGPDRSKSCDPVIKATDHSDLNVGTISEETSFQDSSNEYPIRKLGQFNFPEESETQRTGLFKDGISQETSCSNSSKRSVFKGTCKAKGQMESNTKTSCLSKTGVECVSQRIGHLKTSSDFLVQGTDNTTVDRVSKGTNYLNSAIDFITQGIHLSESVATPDVEDMINSVASVKFISDENVLLVPGKELEDDISRDQQAEVSSMEEPKDTDKDEQQRPNVFDEPEVCDNDEELDGCVAGSSILRSDSASQEHHECTECAEVFQDIVLLKRHKQSHSERKFECVVCDKTFKTSSHLNVHMKIHTAEKNFKCDLCPAAFNQPRFLRNHVEKVHKKLNIYEDGKCRQSFPTEFKLRKHNKIHKGISLVHKKLKIYKCGKWKQSFQNKNKLWKHKRTHKGQSCLSLTEVTMDKNNTAIETEKIGTEQQSRPNVETFASIYSSAESFMAHNESSSRHYEKDNADSGNAATIKEIVDYNENARSGELEDSFVDQSFSGSSRLHSMKSPSKVLGSAVAPSLLKVSTRNESMSLSERKNIQGKGRHSSGACHELSPTKSYKCKECGKILSNKYTLKLHQYCHYPDAKMYACSVCDKKFTTNSRLQIHQVKHLDLLPFKCPVCGQRFVQKVHMKTHVQLIHKLSVTGITVQDKQLDKKSISEKKIQKTFHCDGCGRSFSLLFSLNRHQDKCTKYTAHVEKRNIASASMKIATRRHVTESDDDQIVHRTSSHLSESESESCAKAAASPPPKAVEGSDASHAVTQEVSSGNGSTSLSQPDNRPDKRTKSSAVHKNLWCKKPYKCKECGKILSSRQRLESHQIHHDPEAKKYACAGCGKKFVTAALLQVHNLTHLDVRPFKCPVCDCRFSQKSHVRRHVRAIHNQSIRHYSKSEMSVQDQQLSNKSHKKSLWRKNYQKTFHCDGCGKSYGLLFSLKRHQDKCTKYAANVEKRNIASKPMKMSTPEKKSELDDDQIGHQTASNLAVAESCVEATASPTTKAVEGSDVNHTVTSSEKESDSSSRPALASFHSNHSMKGVSNILPSNDSSVASQKTFHCDGCGRSYSLLFSLKRHQDKCTKFTAHVEKRNIASRSMKMAKHQDDAKSDDDQIEHRTASDLSVAESVAEATASPSCQAFEGSDVSHAVTQEVSSENGSTSLSQPDNRPDKKTKSSALNYNLLSKKQCKCKECGKILSSTQKLKSHVRAIHEHSQGHYSQSGMSVQDRQLSSKSHKKSLWRKNPQKTFHCDSCGRWYSHLFSLKRHQDKCTKYTDNIEKRNIFSKSMKMATPENESESDDDQIVHQTASCLAVAESSVEAAVSPPPKADEGSDVSHAVTQEVSSGNGSTSLSQPDNRQDKKTKSSAVHKNLWCKKQYKCKECGKILSSRQRLESHKIHHDPEAKKYTCAGCGKKFVTAALLQVHNLTHLDVRPFKCPVCDCRFSQKSHVKKHIKAIHNHSFRHFSKSEMSVQDQQLPNKSNKKSLCRKRSQKTFHCDGCDRSYSLLFSLRRNQDKCTKYVFANVEKRNIASKLMKMSTIENKSELDDDQIGHQTASNLAVAESCVEATASPTTEAVEGSDVNHTVTSSEKESDNSSRPALASFHSNHSMKGASNILPSDDSSVASQKTFHCDGCGRSYSLLFSLKRHQDKCTKFTAHVEKRTIASRFMKMATHQNEAKSDDDDKIVHRAASDLSVAESCAEAAASPQCQAFEGSDVSHAVTSENGSTSMSQPDNRPDKKTKSSALDKNVLSKKQYQCKECGKILRSKQIFKIHQFLHNPEEKKYACTGCDKKFATAGLLQVHKGTHAGMLPFKCPVCCQRFSQKGHMRRHIKTVHNHSQVNHSVSTQDQQFSNKSLQSLDGKKKSAKMFTCDGCGRSYNHVFSLQRHQKQYKECSIYIKRRNTSSRSKTNETKSDVDQSVHHVDSDLAKAESCIPSASSQAVAGSAICNVDTSAELTLNPGDAGPGSSKSSEQYEMSSGLAGAPFHVNPSMKSFSKVVPSDASSKNGSLSQSSDNQRKRKNSSALHNKRHSQKQFKCKECGKILSSRANLKNHLFRHSPEAKKFACKSCNKKFATPARLQAHKITHFDELPFKCPVCNHSFAQKANMKRHMQVIHNQTLTEDFDGSAHGKLKKSPQKKSEKMFQCDRCSRSFQHLFSLQRHQKKFGDKCKSMISIITPTLEKDLS